MSRTLARPGASTPRVGGSLPRISWHQRGAHPSQVWEPLFHSGVQVRGANELHKDVRKRIERTLKLANAEPVPAGHHNLTEQVLHFPSLATLAGWLEEVGLPLVDNTTKRPANMPKNKLIAEDTILYGTGELEFNRTKRPRDGYRLLRYGWKEGRDRLSEVMMEFDKQFRREVEKPTWNLNVSGIELDIGAYMAGNPEHMYEYSPGQDNAKAVNITVDTNVRCSACGRRSHDAEPTPPEWLLFRGVAVTMLAQYLMRAGYQVTLRTVTHTWYSSAEHHFPGVLAMDNVSRHHGLLSTGTFMRTVVVDVLEPGRTVDLDNVMFALAHEDYVRRFDYLVHEAYNYLPVSEGGLGAAAFAGPYRRDSSICPVGDLTLGVAFMFPLLSAVDNSQTDIYLPSQVASNDLIDRFGIIDPMNLSGGELEARNLLVGENYALGPQFNDLAGAATWTLSALERLGVRLV